MKIKSLRSALNRAGLATKIDCKGLKHDVYTCSLANAGGILTWYEDRNNGRVMTLHWRNGDDHSDMRDDYFAGFFPKTLRQAIYYISTTRAERGAKSGV